MKTERAIELLHRLQDEQFDGIHGDERREALEMAVRALEGDGDTISRQATIIVIENSGLDDDSKDTVVRVLEQLPSAQPERKKADWEKDEHYGEDAYVCTYCETIWKTGQIKNMHFCPTCGTDMRGESDEL